MLQNLIKWVEPCLIALITKMIPLRAEGIELWHTDPEAFLDEEEAVREPLSLG